MPTRAIYDKINDYGSVSVRLASPEDIRRWSSGEVKKPETINYRTYRSEKDGLFCERIFGPERDWECFCGRYKGIKYKGTVCERCGVTVTHSKVRRKRMGHIELAAPAVHIWFFKAMPSRLGALLDLKVNSLERVIYFQSYIVVDGGDTPLKVKQLLTEDEYRECRAKYGSNFKAMMGAEAIKYILKNIDLEEMATELRLRLKETGSKQKAHDYAKRLKIVEALRQSENKPEWMTLDVIPVIPPDLRPLVLLESGNFATSDLNDLYRRLINRNNRLKKLLDLNAPEVIIKNEKRMLQQSVDALFDNDRCRRPVLGSNNRPLKSLTDMIKGKQGRFRENLLGKRVDYSARSVIVVGPELQLNQCGLPKKIALELYQPFIIRRLKELNFAETIKSAKRMLERKDEEVWDILEDVIYKHPVLLNRAPTLHRMGIQAFEPVLVEGNAIRVHPLVCAGFNADFDGDQMAVHLPLSIEARTEASLLMMSTHNVFSPANGGPIISPSQDIVLGCYYLTVDALEDTERRRTFGDEMEVFLALDEGKLSVRTPILLRPRERRLVKHGPGMEAEDVGEGLVETTAGRVVFNDILPKGIPFYNYVMDKKAINDVISDCHSALGIEPTLKLLDDVKTLGFKYATLSGLSFSGVDLRMPSRKAEIIARAEAQVEKIAKLYKKGVITEGERYGQVIDCWTQATEEVSDEMRRELKNDTRDGKPYLNPIYCMEASGARGTAQQIRQLAGMRGLMAKPSGMIIETPIKANFREGLKVLEYFSSTHGARKGLADTALKTADSGYLTRKLADVAQNVVVNEHDCGTLNGVTKATVYKGDKVEVPLRQLITGRVARTTIRDVVTGEVVVGENELITADKALRIEQLGFEKIRVRSPLTCETPLGVCAKCYGMDLARGDLVEEGMAVGIIAAQSIGEPGTQLTMRTFHIGGTVSWEVEESEIRAKNAGTVKFVNLNVVTNKEGQRVALNRDGEIQILDAKGRELEKHPVHAGAEILVSEDKEVKAKALLMRWDPNMLPILAEMPGQAAFEGIVEGETMKEETDPSGFKRKVIIEHKGNLHPHIMLRDKKGNLLVAYAIPEKAHIVIEEGEWIEAGAVLAKTPREITGTQDITGGLPRVTELFEARRPKDPAVVSEIDGVVELGEKKRGKRTIIVKSDVGEPVTHLVPHGKHLRVHRGSRVKHGDPLVDGPLVPHDILRISGEEALQMYLLREVQNVYRSQSVNIDDKHIEIIIAQMTRRVEIEDPGDTDFLPDSIVDKFQFREENQRVMKNKGKPAKARPVLLGITKAALHSESFISAASFQETTKVLTQAAIAGKVDNLLGLKENVILGHMVPAGTGFKAHHNTTLRKAEPDKLINAQEYLNADN
ncbi:MAG: DNA-directed RNA polymerase subunit beta' [Planctomycetota bacterium]|nr:MAG: DNA-directed RNA polymerase subunit beta' [Planctomycetota bacterium]